MKGTATAIKNDLAKTLADQFAWEMIDKEPPIPKTWSERIVNLGDAWKRAGGKISDVGSKLTNSITKPALGAATAVGGIVIAAGFKRLVGIENARASLTGLGHSAESVDAIMENALNSVKGTSFGMAEAATTAASVVAAGVAPGQELERTLKLVGDAATIAGTDMGTMGSIINKVATSDMMQMDVANQLMDAGIPILQMVGDEMGVTAEEARKLASEGKVSFETFQNALEKGVGGAALASGDTTEGAFKNMMAAAGRAGEQILGEVFPAFKGGLGGITEWIDSNKDTFVSWGQTLKEWFDRIGDAVRGLKTWWDGLSPTVQGLVGKFAVFAVAAGPVLGIVGKIVSGVGGAISIFGKLLPVLKMAGTAFKVLGSAMLMNPIGLIITLVAGLVAAFIYAWNNFEGFRNFWIGLWEAIKTAFFATVDWIKTTWQSIVDWFTGMWAVLSDVFSSAWEGIKEIVSSAITWVSNFISTVIDNISASWSAVWGAISNFFSAIWQGIVAFVTAYINAVRTVITGVINAIRAVWSSIWNAIRTVVTTVWSAISSGVSNAINAVRNVISSVLNSIRSTWNNIWNGIKSFFSNIWSGLRTATSNGINRVMNLVTGIKDRISGAFRNAVSWLKDAGRNIIQGLINGITGAVKGAVDAVKNAVGSVISGAKSMLGIKSPSRVFRDEVGAMIGAGLAEGIDRSAGLVDRATGRLVDVPAVPGFSPSGVPANYVGSDGGSAVDVLARLADVLENLPNDTRAGLRDLFEVQAGRSQRDERVR